MTELILGLEEEEKENDDDDDDELDPLNNPAWVHGLTDELVDELELDEDDDDDIETEELDELEAELPLEVVPVNIGDCCFCTHVSG